MPELTTTPRRDAAAWFSPDYATARATFLEAATAAGAELASHPHPTATGPSGEPLSVDVAVLGDPGADRIFLTTSGTHGIEGFGGSAGQSAFLGSLDTSTLPDGVTVVVVHSLNPWGFAHRRRTNEDNVDVNRNFVRHDDPPVNERYEVLHPHVLPDDWGGPAYQAANHALLEAIIEWGATEMQEALTRGQYTRPEGLFYGGDRPSWSNRTWRAILEQHAAGRSRVAFVDLHTGLGPFAVGEAIFRARYEDGGLDRARRWYGEVTSSEQGTSVSTVIGGTTHAAVVDAAPDAEVTTITLEFGTQPGREVLTALRAANWVDRRGDRASDLGAEADRLMLDAFYPDDDTWREAVVARALDVLARGIAGVASD